jgi:hypothetical protein
METMMRTLLALLFVALIAGAPSLADAKSGKANFKGHKGAHGASYYAPGHVKKRLGLQSARSVAPGPTKRAYYMRWR